MTTLERLTTVTPNEELMVELPKIYFNFLLEKTEDFLFECRRFKVYVDEYGNLIDSNNKLRYCSFDYYGYLAFAEKEFVCLTSKNKATYLKLKKEIKEAVKH